MHIQWLKQFAKLFFLGIFIFLILLPISMLLSVETRILFLITIITIGIWQGRRKILPRLKRHREMVSIVSGAVGMLGGLIWWMTGNLSSLVVLVVVGVVFVLGVLVFVD